MMALCRKNSKEPTSKLSDVGQHVTLDRFRFVLFAGTRMNHQMENQFELAGT